MFISIISSRYDGYPTGLFCLRATTIHVKMVIYVSGVEIRRLRPRPLFSRNCDPYFCVCGTYSIIRKIVFLVWLNFTLSKMIKFQVIKSLFLQFQYKNALFSIYFLIERVLNLARLE